MKPTDNPDKNYGGATYTPSTATPSVGIVGSPSAFPRLVVEPSSSSASTSSKSEDLTSKPSETASTDSSSNSSSASALESPSVPMAPVLPPPAVSGFADFTSSQPSTSNKPTKPFTSSPHAQRFSVFHLNRTALLITIAVVSFIALVGLGSLVFSKASSKSSKSSTSTNSTNTSPTNQYAVGSLPLTNLSPTTTELSLGTATQLAINGQLLVNSTLVLNPTTTPTTPTAGQLYYDKTTNQPYFYNGSSFVSLQPTTTNVSTTSTPTTTSPQTTAPATTTTSSTSVTTSLNGLTGTLTLADSSSSSGTITINDASTTQKGIAQFNATNFTSTAGVINTAQNIATTASPTFANLQGGTITATTFSGNGSSITALNATNIASGTVADARLSTNVALLNGSGPQTFSGNNKYTGTILQQNASNSTSAFQIQNAVGTAVLTIDTTNALVVANGDFNFSSGANRTLSVSAPATNVAGNTLTVAAGNGGAGATGVAGANLIFKAGNAAGTSGAAVGGNVVIHWGAAVNGAPSADGTVKIQDAAGNDYFQFDNGSTVGSNGSMTCGLFFSNPCSLRANNTLNLVANQAAAAVNLFPGTAGAVVKPSANTTTDFTVQNAAGTAIFTTDSTNSQIVLGTSSSINGQLKVLNATNTNAVTIVTGATSASYSLTLPTAGPAVSQCLQSDATTASQLKFATCGSAHAKTVILTAEYAGAVLDAGTGANNSGTITSGIDLTNRENYYKWVTTQATSQSYDVDVQVPIPSDFSSWGATPISIDTYSTDTTNGTLQVEARTTAGVVETGCNFAAITPTVASTWQTKTCTIAGTYTAGGYMTLRVRMYATSAVSAVRIGNITLNYNSAY